MDLTNGSRDPYFPSYEEMDAAIQEVVEKFGSSNRNKHRVVFYYLLAQKFGKEAMFVG